MSITYKLFKHPINNDYKVITDSTIPINYNDVSLTANIHEWLKACDKNGKDYKFKRKLINYLYPINVDDTTWNSYSQNLKFTICTYRCTTLERCRVVLGNDLYYWMSYFDLESYESRRLRINMARTLMLSNVTQLTAFTLKMIIDRDQLFTSYLNDGVEGIMEGDVTEGLFDFVLSTPLSAYGGVTHDPIGNPLGKYENIGFGANPVTEMLPDSPYTKEQLVEKIYNCLKYGIY